MANTNEKFWFNLEDHGAGRIFVTIAGKKMPLRYTLCQQEQLSHLFDGQRQAVATDKTETIEPIPTSQFARSYQQDLDLCLIALNPQPNKLDFTREDIKENLDLDQVKLLAWFWFNKKVVSPTMAGEQPAGK